MAANAGGRARPRVPAGLLVRRRVRHVRCAARNTAPILRPNTRHSRCPATPGYLVERTPGWHHAVRQAVKACGVDLKTFVGYFTFKPDLIQKGVDALITLDLVNLTDAYSWAVLVAGDKDLVEAVWPAQDEGCRVCLAVPSGSGVARELRRQADELLTIPDDILQQVLPMRRARKGEPMPMEEVEVAAG